jgi:hypothetical protein
VKQKYTHWNDDLIIKEAKKYQYLTDFRKTAIGAFNAAKKRGDEFYNMVTKHLIINKPYKKLKIKWTRETIAEEAKKYKYRVDFQKKSGGAFNEAYRIGKEFFRQITQHMVSKRKELKFSDNEIIEVAKKYDNLKDFREKHPTLYNHYKLRKLDKIYKFKIVNKKSKKYSEEYIIKMGEKYDYASDFMKYDKNLYCVAQSQGLLGKIKYKKGFKQLNLHRRLVYVYEFPDNHFYCGLTFNENKRHEDHLQKGPIRNHIDKTNLIPIKKIVSDGYILCEDARILEEETRLLYIEKGWKPLNKQRCGGVGGGRTKWTEKMIREEAAKYKFMWEFKIKNLGALSAAKRLGIHGEIVKNLKKKYEYDMETCKKIARKYFDYKGFFNSDDSKYLNYIYKKKWDKQLCSHFINKGCIILDESTGVYYYGTDDTFKHNNFSTVKKRFYYSLKNNKVNLKIV